MSPISDQELLQRHATRGDDEAFAELVRRYVDFVYSAALRMVCDAHLAEDVSQQVFVALAQASGGLAPKSPVLPSWLHRTARNIAANTVRSEVRRRQREEEAVKMHQLLSEEPARGWEEIAPHLDSAIDSLNETDRAALLLRFFQKKSAREIAAVLNTSEDAAQKRVNRAVDRLRDTLSARGVALGLGGLAVLLGQNSVQAAPLGLGAKICGATAGLAAAISGGTAGTITQTIAMTTTQKAITAALVATTLGFGLFETSRASRLESELAAAQGDRSSLRSSLDKIARDRDQASNLLAGLSRENARLRRSADELSLAKKELALFKSEGKEPNPNDTGARAWLARLDMLKSGINSTPGALIPEMKLLTDNDWLNAAKEPLNSEADFRKAYAMLRSAAENKYLQQIQIAMKNYRKANNNEFPPDVNALKSYFTDGDPELLGRYVVAPEKSVESVKMGSDWIITVKEPVDREFDTLWVLGPNGYGSTTYKTQEHAVLLREAYAEFQAANPGKQVKDGSELIPYIKNPEKRAEFEKQLKEYSK